MKILFAVNNDNISEAIVKKYQKEYNEILSYKNVYYFNAILRELQKDKSYSRIVISEDLEPFANNNYDAIDKFLFEKYSGIAKDAKGTNGERIEIILICADRRKRTDNIIVKFYKNEIYNAILGQDRSIDEICRLINSPKDKEEARKYYNIQENELGDVESEASVSETEVENIRAYYVRLGKNEDKYVECFNNIVSQYTDEQLKIIIKYLPMNVKAVLETRSPKYQQLALQTSNNNQENIKRKTPNYNNYQDKNRKKQTKQINSGEDEVVDQFIKPTNIKNVVVPSTMKTNNVQKVVIPKIKKPEYNAPIIIEDKLEEEEKANTPEMQEAIEQEPPKRGRGRPKKQVENIEANIEQKPKRGRGRPRKNETLEEPQKIEEDINLFDLNEETNSANQEDIELFDIDEETNNTNQEDIDLFDINDETSNDDQEDIDLFGLEENSSESSEQKKELLYSAEPEENLLYSEKTEQNRNNMYVAEDSINNYIANTKSNDTNFNKLLTSDKKIVAFVGTTKNGTSFIVNNTAEMLSTMGINTAILDMTKTRNAYYIYTNNEEHLRTVTRDCMTKLQNGIVEGINVNKNLTVFTQMPDAMEEFDLESALSTLVKNYSAILIDTDFDTNALIFEKVQEIYLVQSMDVLTVQPLTAFLRNLKSKGILKPEKLKIVINKAMKIRTLSSKTLIGGISCYNAPNMSYMTELFNKDNIQYCEIPFDVQNYARYLDSLVNCSISLNGYSKQFLMALRELTSMVYPLIGKQSYSPMSGKKTYKEPFSNEVNDTLNKMKNSY